MRKSIIVAKATNQAIGIHNKLPWHLPNDLKHFKHTTLGHHLILGRKTFTSLPNPLPGRKLIVLTRHPDHHTPTCQTAPNLTTAFAMAQTAGETEVFIAGGSTVYEAALADADKIYLTEVHADDIMGDTFFPTLDATQWIETQRIPHAPDAQHAYAYDFVEYIRAQ
ncbi:MAG: dihydrofolate reductase [Bacteroidota bacterium]